MGSDQGHQLDALLYPRSIGVIGASDAMNKWGGRILTYLINYGYRGTVYPVNSKYREVMGLRCYPDLRSLPQAPDTVVMAVPNRFIPDLIKECAEIGARNAVIITSGFAETGEAGRGRQEEVKRLARQAGLRIVGPNCLGITSSSHRMALTASLALQAGVLLEGSIGFVSQSGAMAGSFLNRAQDRGIGLRYMISTGNEVDLELAEFIDYMVDDPGTEVIAAFIEGARNPGRLLKAFSKALQVNKPIVVLKVGRSERGSRSARSHTAALTGSDTAYDAIFKQNGVIRVDTFDGLLDTIKLLSKARLPKGSGIGVVTSSGGACGLISDRSQEIGVDIPDLTPTIAAEIAEAMGLDSVENPIDVGSAQSGGPEGEVLLRIIKGYDADPKISALLAVLTTMPGLKPTGEALAAYARTDRKPVIVLSTAGSVADEALRIVEEAGIPVFQTMDEGLKAIKGWVWRARFMSGAEARTISSSRGPAPDVAAIKASLAGKKSALTEPEAKAILAAYGIPITKETVATSGRQAARIAREIGFPVALKIVSPDILHKTEAGGIKLNLKSEREVLAAFDEVMASARACKPTPRIEGALVQEMVSDGVEAIVGMSKDRDFGPTLMFGLGGVFVELLKDVAVRLAPINAWDASEMVREIKSYRVLEGLRGRAPRDVAAIEDVLLKLSRLTSDLADLIDEIDINPLMVLADGRGARAVDALIVLKKSES
ncbi:MAG: acetate--CoA ligase family protein [Chloroflexota bacterium]